MISRIIPGVFVRFDPDAQARPIILDVARSGREYPPTFRSAASFTDVHDNVSMYVEELWGDAPSFGGTLLYACFPNTFIDVNRGPLDIDPDLLCEEWPIKLQPTSFSARGLGLLKKVTRYGQPLHEARLAVADVKDRLVRYYEPFHAELAAAITQARSSFQRVLHLSCHCMSSVGAATHPDRGQERADICLADANGTTSSSEFLQFVRASFESLGYSVSINTPYVGGEIVRRYGRPSEGVESLLVEANKKLFMDSATFRKNANFTKVRSDFAKVTFKLAQYADEHCPRR